MQPGEKYPAFLFYPLDFFNDENVILMDNRHIGCYMRLLGHQWIEHSVPDALPKIAKICKEDASAMAELWLAIEPCFQPHPALPGRLFNHRLEEERAKLELKRQERSESGSRGARARWDKESGPLGPPKLSDSSAIAQPVAQPIANDGIPIPIPMPNTKQEETVSPPIAGSGEPATQNQKPPDKKAPKSEDYTPDFLEFWETYPRKIDKKGAFACWKTRLKNGVDPADILQACRHYQQHCAGKEQRFILHPSTFLGPNDRWKDYSDQASAKPDDLLGVAFLRAAPASKRTSNVFLQRDQPSGADYSHITNRQFRD